MIQPAVRPWTNTAHKPRTNARPSDPTIATGTMDFRSAGSCRAFDPEIFFPNSHGGKESQQEKRAKRICAACPVLDLCRAWVEANPKLTEFGIWAATSETERRKDLFNRIAAQR